MFSEWIPGYIHSCECLPELWDLGEQYLHETLPVM